MKARDAEEQRGFEQAPVVDEPLHVPATPVIEAQLAAVVQRHESLEQSTEAVMPGQVAQEDVLVVDIPDQRNRLLLGDDVAMAQLDALRWARGAGGIHHHGEIIGPDGLDAALQALVARATGRRQFSDRVLNAGCRCIQ